MDVLSVSEQTVRIAAKVTVMVFVLKVPTRNLCTRRLFLRVDQVSIREGAIDSSKRDELVRTQTCDLLSECTLALTLGESPP